MWKKGERGMIPPLTLNLGMVMFSLRGAAERKKRRKGLNSGGAEGSADVTTCSIHYQMKLSPGPRDFQEDVPRATRINQMQGERGRKGERERRIDWK